MSDFLERLDAKRSKKLTTESMTIRVSAEEDAAIKELANVYDCTRQDLIHELITDYLMPAWHQLLLNQEALRQAPLETAGPAYYVLNTNKANHLSDHQFMMAEGVAAAFEDGYKEKIERLKAGDVIFLYESGAGIVAFGAASGSTKKRDHNGRPDKTYFQELTDFIRLDAPCSPKEITRILLRNIKFVQTLTSLHDGEVMLKALKKLPAA